MTVEFIDNICYVPIQYTEFMSKFINYFTEVLTFSFNLVNGRPRTFNDFRI